MIFTPTLQKALQFATKVHQGQTRKGKDIQYITHPITVALILSRVTDDENVICAGILHDTIEDCKPYGSITREMIAQEFNEEIAQMVDDVTEKDKTLPWFERKMEALKHIQNMSRNSLLVKSADVLHNLADLNMDIEKDGVGVLDKFNASREDVIRRFKKLIPEIKKYYPENPLMGDLESELGRLHGLSTNKT